MHAIGPIALTWIKEVSESWPINIVRESLRRLLALCEAQLAGLLQVVSLSIERRLTCKHTWKNNLHRLRNTTYVPNAVRNYMSIGANDALAPASLGCTNARNAEARAEEYCAKMFTHTNWIFLVGFSTKLGPHYEKKKRRKGSIDQRTCGKIISKQGEPHVSAYSDSNRWLETGTQCRRTWVIARENGWSKSYCSHR